MAKTTTSLARTADSAPATATVSARIAAGEAALWPADIPHAAWTEHSEMRAFVVELAGADDGDTVAGRVRAAEAAEGLDGRRLRKLVAAATAMRAEARVDPNELTGADLVAAIAAAEVTR